MSDISACPECGASVEAGDFFCPDCGLLLRPEMATGEYVLTEPTIVRALLSPRSMASKEVPRPPRARRDDGSAHTEKTALFTLPMDESSVARLSMTPKQVATPMLDFEAYVASFIDGEQTVPELARTARLPLIEVQVVLKSLLEKRFIELHPRPKPKAARSLPEQELAQQQPEALEPEALEPEELEEEQAAERTVIAAVPVERPAPASARAPAAAPAAPEPARPSQALPRITAAAPTEPGRAPAAAPPRSATPAPATPPAPGAPPARGAAPRAGAAPAQAPTASPRAAPVTAPVAPAVPARPARPAPSQAPAGAAARPAQAPTPTTPAAGMQQARPAATASPGAQGRAAPPSRSPAPAALAPARTPAAAPPAAQSPGESQAWWMSATSPQEPQAAAPEPAQEKEPSPALGDWLFQGQGLTGLHEAAPKPAPTPGHNLSRPPAAPAMPRSVPSMAGAEPRIKLHSASLESPLTPATPRQDLTEDFLQRAVRFERAGQVDRAIETLEQAISQIEDAAPLYNKLALILLQQRKDYSRAMRMLERATELDPDNGVYQQNLVKVVALAATEAADDGKKRKGGSGGSGGLLSSLLGRR